MAEHGNKIPKLHLICIYCSEKDMIRVSSDIKSIIIHSAYSMGPRSGSF